MLLEADRLPPPELDVGQHGHLADGEDQGELAALGRRLVVVGLDSENQLVFIRVLTSASIFWGSKGWPTLLRSLALIFSGGWWRSPRTGSRRSCPRGACRLAECPGAAAGAAPGTTIAASQRRRVGARGASGAGSGRRGRCRPDRVSAGVPASAAGAVGPPGVLRIRPTAAVPGAGGIWHSSDLMSDRFLTDSDREPPGRRHPPRGRHPRRRDGDPSASDRTSPSRPVRRSRRGTVQRRAGMARGDLPGGSGARRPRPSRL